MMEDILKEAEKEIAQAKPSPYKSRRKTEVMVIDSYGEMKSGTYLRILARFFSVTSLILGLTTLGLYLLYTQQTETFSELTQKVAILEQETKNLTKEKDIYMTRLVLFGQMKKNQIAAVTKADPSAKLKKRRSAVTTKTDGV